MPRTAPRPPMLWRVLSLALGLVPVALAAAGFWFHIEAKPKAGQALVKTLHPKPDAKPNPARKPGPAPAVRTPAAATPTPAPAPRLTAPLKEPRIIIFKSARRAELYSGGQLVKRYKIALGPNPAGHKSRKGDGRTPEGQYRLCSRLERSQYHIFLGLNYPSLSDAEAGLKRGAITREDMQRIAEAQRKREMPPWDTPLSGAIGLHGGGADSDWTLGCVAFDNRDIEELCAATQHWTPVEIRP